MCKVQDMEYIGEYDFQLIEVKAYVLLTTLWNYKFFYAVGEV
jgi:hypothetical protein